MLYRNFDDSCRSDFLQYGLTKSIYSLQNGTWVAQFENRNTCAGTPEKAHLGPSSDYGYTYVQSKCLNTGTQTFTLNCWTTEP